MRLVAERARGGALALSHQTAERDFAIVSATLPGV